MSSKEISQNKVNAAIEACEHVQTYWNAAMNSLCGNLSTNGYGIYRDQFEVKNKLMFAKSSIEQALQTINAIDWPTNDDYNQMY